MKKCYFLIAGLFMHLVALPQSSATLICDKDNTIYSAFVNNSNGTGEYLFAGKNSSANNNSVQRALIHFDLSSIPADAIITSATLTLTVNKSAPSATGIELHKVTAGWGEGTSNGNGNEASGAPATTNDATWNMRMFPSTAWTTAGGDFAADVSAFVVSISDGISSSTPVILTGAQMTADVQSWINNNATNFGWIIKSNNEGIGASIKRFISANNAQEAARPTLTLTYTSGTLPVTLSNFTAARKGNDIVLYWETSTELNNEVYQVQHSSDGVHFETIGRLSGSGTSNLKNTYTYTQANPGNGSHYYRLLQQDLNGVAHYSTVISLRNNLQNDLKLFPNPVKELLTVYANSSLHGAHYSIRALSGQVIGEGKIDGQHIRVGKLLNGRYWITINTPSGEIIRRTFLKN